MSTNGLPGRFKVVTVTEKMLHRGMRVFAEFASGSNAVFPTPGESPRRSPCASSTVDGEELRLLVIELLTPLSEDGVRLSRDVDLCVSFAIVPGIRDGGKEKCASMSTQSMLSGGC